MSINNFKNKLWKES